MSDLEVNIETQTFRAIPSERVEIGEAVKFANARSNGEFAVIEHQDPHALVVIDTVSYTHLTLPTKRIV